MRRGCSSAPAGKRWSGSLGAAAEWMEPLGPRSGSLAVLPVLFTPRTSDLLEASRTNHSARGMTRHSRASNEAEAASRLFGAEPTQKRMDFTAAPERIG